VSCRSPCRRACRTAGEALAEKEEVHNTRHAVARGVLDEGKCTRVVPTGTKVSLLAAGKAPARRLRQGGTDEGGTTRVAPTRVTPTRVAPTRVLRRPARREIKRLQPPPNRRCTKRRQRHTEMSDTLHRTRHTRHTWRTLHWQLCTHTRHTWRTFRWQQCTHARAVSTS
jgi:hypothetical protein